MTNKNICSGIGKCLIQYCWCLNETYVHGFADESGYCKECKDRSKKHRERVGAR